MTTLQNHSGPDGKICGTLASAGLTLAVHYHGWEFEKIHERLKYEVFSEFSPAAWQCQLFDIARRGRSGVIEVGFLRFGGVSN